jgi:putative transcriptional regulator
VVILIRLSLDRYLDSHGITRYELAKRTDVRFQVIDKYYKNKVVRYDSYLLEKFCDALGCGIADLIEYKPDSEK